jgi:hypothetical protein
MINKKTGNPYWDPTNVTNTPNGGILASQNCQNQPDTTHIPRTFPIGNNGLLSIIDVDKATKGGGQGTILVSIASGCFARSGSRNGGRQIYLGGSAWSQLELARNAVRLGRHQRVSSFSFRCFEVAVEIPKRRKRRFTLYVPNYDANMLEVITAQVN